MVDGCGQIVVPAKEVSEVQDQECFLQGQVEEKHQVRAGGGNTRSYRRTRRARDLPRIP